MPDIKTRATAEKSVKTIDKSAIAAQRMKLHEIIICTTMDENEEPLW